MATAVDLRVTPMTPALVSELGNLRVTAEQVQYVGDIALHLLDALRDPHSHAMAIVLGQSMIGCYRIDLAPTIVTATPLGPNSLGLRAFVIDHRWQGRGLGVNALHACCGDLQRRHPQRRLLALNVDCANLAAIRTYRKAGFIASGELYAGGKVGPQLLMLRWLG